MADRYWVGGTGTWNSTNTTNWSATNGGAGGQSVPTAADNVFFTSLSGGGTCTNSGTNACLSLNMTGYTGTFAGINVINISGNLTLSASGSLTYTGAFSFAAGATTNTVNTNGKTIPGNLNSNKTSGTLQLSSAVTVSGQVNINTASFNLNGFTLTTAYFNYTGVSLTWGSPAGKVVCSRSTAGIAFSNNGASIATGGRIEILSPPSGVTITAQGNISKTAVADLPDVYLINSGTGTIDHVGAFYRIINYGAGSYGVSGTAYCAREFTVDASYTGTCSNGVFLRAIDTGGIDFNPNGKTFTNAIFNIDTSPSTANGACPIRVNQSVTFSGTNTFQWFGGQFSINNNSTVTVHSVRFDPRPTLNNSFISFPGTSKLVCTAASGVAVRAVTNFYVRTQGNANSNPIEVTAPASGQEIQIECCPGEDGSTGRIKCFGIRVLAGGTGTVRFQQPNIATSENITLKDLYLHNSGYTVTQQYLQNFQIARNLSSGPLVGNLIQGFYFVSNSAIVQEVDLNGAGGFGMYIDNNVNGPVRLLSNAGSTGQGVYLSNQISNIYFGNVNSGAGKGFLELQSFSITSRGSIQQSTTFTDTVNINFGTGKIRFYSETVSAVTFASYNEGFAGTITGSKNLELLPFGTLAEGYTRYLTINHVPTAGKELNVRVVNTGSTGKVLLSLIPGTLTLESGVYTYGIGSSSTEVYGNINLLGSIAFDTSFFFNTPSAAFTSTITSNGNTFNTQFTLNGSGHTTVLADALICKTISHIQGTLNFNNNSLTVTSSFSTSGGSARTLNFGTTGSITLAQNSSFTNATSTNLTLSGTSRQIFATVGTSGCTITTDSSFTAANAFDITTVVVGSGGTVTAGGLVRNLTLNGGTYTFSMGADYYIVGNLLMNGAVSTMSGNTTSLNFTGTSGTQTINTNGNNFGSTGAISFTATGSTKQLTGNSNFNDRACTLSSGTLDLNGYRLTVFSFNTSNANVRTLAFGSSGAIQLRGSGVAFNATTQTNLTVTGSNPVIEPNLNSSQTISFGTTNPPVFDLSVPSTASNGTLTITSSDRVRNLTFANVTYTVANTIVLIHGSVTILGTTPTFTGGTNPWRFSATSGSHVITTNGKSIPFDIEMNGAGSTLALGDNLTVDANRVFYLNNGTLDLGTRILNSGQFRTSNTNVRQVTFGTGSRIIVNTIGSTFTAQDSTNLTVTGTDRIVEVRTTGGTGTVSGGTTASESALFDLVVSSSATNTVQAQRYWRNITLQNGTYSYSSPSLGSERVYGNFTILGTSMTLPSGTTALTFAATSGTKTIQTSGKTIPFPLTFDGVGGTWQLNDALTVSAGLVNTLTNGTFNANNFSVTMGSFASNNSNVRALQMGNATWTLSDSSTFWNLATTTNMTLTRGTGASAAIVTTGTSAKTFQGGGLTYPRLTHSSNSVLTIAGTNTRFADITRGIAAATTFTFTAGQTFLFDDWNLSGVSTGARTVVNSTSGTQHILSKSSGTISSDFLSITSSNATGGASWYAGTGSLNNSNNTGWIFTAPPQASGNMLMVFM